MAHKHFLAAAALSLSALLAACEGEPEVSQASFQEIREASRGDPGAFKEYFDGIKGKAVAWTGHVVEAREQYEDDYMKSAVLLVDMDGPGQSSAVADVEFKISVSDLAKYQPGQEVAFTAIVREFERRGDLLLKLEPREVR